MIIKIAATAKIIIIIVLRFIFFFKKVPTFAVLSGPVGPKVLKNSTTSLLEKTATSPVVSLIFTLGLKSDVSKNASACVGPSGLLGRVFGLQRGSLSEPTRLDLFGFEFPPYSGVVPPLFWGGFNKV